MNSVIGEPHVLLGAYVLGALADKDEEAFTSHLRWCQRCRAELADVAGLPRLLDLVDPATVDALARS